MTTLIGSSDGDARRIVILLRLQISAMLWFEKVAQKGIGT
jgi:hypothetical protein